METLSAEADIQEASGTNGTFELIAAMRLVILFCSHRLLAVFGGKISLMFGLNNWIKPPLENKTRSKLR